MGLCNYVVIIMMLPKTSEEQILNGFLKALALCLKILSLVVCGVGSFRRLMEPASL